MRRGNALAGHQASSVIKLGWASLDDGPLLDIMADQFDVLITTDRSLRFQQRLEGRTCGILLLRARSNRLPDLLPLVPAVPDALKKIRRSELLEIAA